MQSPGPNPENLRARLGLWDAVNLIIGIVIGAGIYETPPYVFSKVSGPWTGMGVWALAGLLCLIGSLCYAELATTYPRIGGDYFYLTRAYGPPVGFLYGWAQLAVIETGNIGMMAYVFADYCVRLFDLGPGSDVILAVSAVAVLAILNMLGVAFGTRTQNVLTTAKVIGLAAIVVVGFVWGKGMTSGDSSSGAEIDFPLAAAFVPVFLTYGGWNDAAFVAAELRNRRRNIPLALILGTAAITVIYLLVNGAYLLGLGFEGVRNSKAVAADVLALAPQSWGNFGAKAMCLIVMVSALGAVNGLIFTSSRIYAALGADYSLFAPLGRWNVRTGSPLWSFLTLTLISLALIVIVGTNKGQGIVNQLLVGVSLGEVKWTGHGGFDTLLQLSAPIFWFFFLLSGIALFVLRWKDRGLDRPFTVPLFPIVPLIFCATCAYMLYGGIIYAGQLGTVGTAMVLLGVPLYLISKKRIGSTEFTAD
jgi:amino acid transporter